MQLQRLDAPSELLDAGDRAMNDAAIHARTSSALAYTLLGRDDLVAPEPDWPVPASVPDEEGVALVIAVARHGCIEATLLAASVRAAMRHARDPRIAAALRSTALGADRRAAFAWRALRWLLESVVGSGSLAILGPALDAVYHEAYDVLDSASPRDQATTSHATTTRLGQLAPAERSAVAASILQRVIKPRFDALTRRPR